MTITSLSQLDPTKQYTYADYLTWQFVDRRLKIELFNGRIYAINSSKKYELVRSFSENDTAVPLVSFPDVSVNFKEIVGRIERRWLPE